MKRILSLALLGMFAAGIIGCEASAGIDKPASSDNSRDVHEKTVTDANGRVIEHEKTVEHNNP